MRFTTWIAVGRPSRFAALAVSFCLVIFGCSSPSAGKVAGKVSLGGKPLPSVVVTVIPEQGAAVTATSGPDGAYAAVEVPTGPAIVTVTILPTAEPAAPAAGGGKTQLGKRDSPTGVPKPPDTTGGGKIPKIYTDPLSTTLKLTVKPGTNDFDIDVK